MRILFVFLTIETEEGFEVVFFVENPDGGSYEDQKKEEETHLSAFGTSLDNRDGGTLEGGKGWGFFLYLHFCLLKLGHDLLVYLLLHLHLVL